MTPSNTARTALFSMGEEGYAAFQAKLLPTLPCERLLGVRTPALRRYAASIADTATAEAFLLALPHSYHDENNLHAALLCLETDFDRALEQVERFLPYVDNWATCDMLCPKAFRTHRAQLLAHLRRWMKSDAPFTVRFALVRLLSQFLEDAFFPELLQWTAELQHSDYYVRIAQAWLFSMALAKQYEATLPYFTEGKLSPWLHQKSIQKALESFQVCAEHKAELKALRNIKPKEEPTT